MLEDLAQVVGPETGVRQMAVQFRIMDSTDKRFYSPGRDLAYIGHKVLDSAIALFDYESATSRTQTAAAISSVTESQLCDAAVAAARLINCVPREDIASFSEALVESGIASLPRAVADILLMSIGEVVLPLIFNAMRSVTPLNSSQIAVDVDEAIRLAILQAELAHVPRWRRWLAAVFPGFLGRALVRGRISSRMLEAAALFRWFKCELNNEGGREDQSHRGATGGVSPQGSSVDRDSGQP